MTQKKETISLTFGDQGENHVGMEKIGNMVEPGNGFSYADFTKYKKICNEHGYDNKIYDLNKLYAKDKYYLENIKDQIDVDKAYVMIIRNGMELFLNENKTSADVYKEMNKFEWDTKYYDVRRSKILNKHARSNVCFGKKKSEPDYENRRGRIVGYSQVPNVNSLRINMKKIFGNKFDDLICEGNRYFDLNKCGIGWHGDSERRKVVAFRLGTSMNLNYNWFHKSTPFGNTITFKLNDGDMYIMSEKAVGTDWKKKNICTLRHSAGITNSKYTKL
jgi:hypothetical protein